MPNALYHLIMLHTCKTLMLEPECSLTLLATEHKLCSLSQKNAYQTLLYVKTIQLSLRAIPLAS